MCLQAYNDWMIDEWCGAAPGRYIPLVIIPLWDPPLAAVEMERCAAKGATAFCFSENPEPLGLPTIHDKDRYWDPVMAAASRPRDGRVHARRLVVHAADDRAPTRPFWRTSPGARSAPRARCSTWLFCDYFDRMPDLKIALSEGNIGWIPYFLERAEQVVDKQRHWVTRGVGFIGRRRRPPGVDLDTFDVRAPFRDHVFGCFIDDVHGIASLDNIGEDNVMIETDYPHTDSTWPDCIGLVEAAASTTSPRRRSTRSCAATPSGCTASRRPSRRCRRCLAAAVIDRPRAVHGKRHVHVSHRHVRHDD